MIGLFSLFCRYSNGLPFADLASRQEPYYRQNPLIPCGIHCVRVGKKGLILKGIRDASQLPFGVFKRLGDLGDSNQPNPYNLSCVIKFGFKRLKLLWVQVFRSPITRLFWTNNSNHKRWMG